MEKSPKKELPQLVVGDIAIRDADFKDGGLTLPKPWKRPGKRPGESIFKVRPGGSWVIDPVFGTDKGMVVIVQDEDLKSPSKGLFLIGLHIDKVMNSSALAQPLWANGAAYHQIMLHHEVSRELILNKRKGGRTRLNLSVKEG